MNSLPSSRYGEKMSYEIIKIIEDKISSGEGDTGRLRFILNSLMKGKQLYLTDRKYLEGIISSHNACKHSLESLDDTGLTKPTENKLANTRDLNNFSIHSTQNRHLEVFEKKSQPAQVSIGEEIDEIKEKLGTIMARLQRVQKSLESIEDNLTMMELYNDPFFNQEQKQPSITVQSVQNKKRTDNDKTDFVKIAKVLVVASASIWMALLATLMLFGVIDGTPRWQDYGITFNQAESILNGLILATIFVMVSWPALGITYLVKKFSK